MNCPSDTANIILEILRRGILRARAAAWQGDSERSAVETDHIHNLPELLLAYSDEQLRYYWEAGRTTFMSQAEPASFAEFEPLWEKLATQLELTQPQ